jgi:serine/threonine protein phosphatase PrpC
MSLWEVGWRKNMEDACIHEIDIGDGNSLFSVFDGHGGTCEINVGAEVSQYVKQIFIDVLKSTPEYKKK